MPHVKAETRARKTVEQCIKFTRGAADEFSLIAVFNQELVPERSPEVFSEDHVWMHYDWPTSCSESLKQTNDVLLVSRPEPAGRMDGNVPIPAKFKVLRFGRQTRQFIQSQSG